MNALISLHDHSLGAYAAISGSAALIGTIVGDALPWLQAIAYLVSIAVGVCALIKYWREHK
jgi:hypothetical protein